MTNTSIDYVRTHDTGGGVLAAEYRVEGSTYGELFVTDAEHGDGEHFVAWRYVEGPQYGGGYATEVALGLSVEDAVAAFLAGNTTIE